MRTIETKYIAMGLLLLLAQCRKPYVPVVFTKGDNYLVVDGFINTSAGGITSIVLSRTKNLSDTVLTIPERNASVAIQSVAGISYSLQETGTGGMYNSNALTLNNGQYRIIITTSGGKQYQSDLVSSKQTPSIDSITWRQDSKGVNLFVNTHDPSNSTRFYRWQYVQTWEYHSQLETVWGISNGLVYARDAVDQVHVCYNTTPSNEILIGTSAALAQDMVSEAPIGVIPQNDTTLQYRASFLVKQYALSPEAYFYWQIIQKNSQQLGTLFDLQPSQLEGNIHAVANASEPVVGYMSASTVTEKRIFINNTDLQNWQSPPGSYNCQLMNKPQNAANFLLVTLPDDSYAVWYYISMGPVVLAKNVCLDCTLSGGTNKKPGFW